MSRQRSVARKEFLHNIFSCALEGGIGYWSACEKYHWQGDHFDGILNIDLDGFYAVIVPEDPDGWGVYERDDFRALRVDIDVVAKGLRLFREGVAAGKYSYPGGGEYFKELVKADRSNGADGDYDAIGADAVVQLGLFGEIVYG